MPIIITDFVWNQTESSVTIKVPLKGAIPSKTDIFTSPQYIKASFEKYFFEAFLAHKISTEESKCIFTTDALQFELSKVEKQLWEQLEVDLNKQEKQELKRKVIQEGHKKVQDVAKKLAEKKSELKRTAVREQICLDTKQRQLIDEIRTKEKANALGDVDNWKHSLVTKKPEKSHCTPIKKCVATPVPLPRNIATVEVVFTPREFPTPSRESQAEEEEEWLKKQAAARRSVGFVSEDLRPEEKNPQYLKEKGDEFLKAENYLGAISAYSFGIKLRDTFPDLYVGRAEAHLAQGNYYKTVHDCSKALELLQPAVEANLNDRSFCICRRGIALCKLGMPEKGVEEIEAALRLNGRNERLRKLINESGCLQYTIT